MALAIQSTSTVTWQGSNSCVITKPTGLTAGDLMVAIVAAANGTLTPPSGSWTLIISGTSSGANEKFSAWWKIADASDVAASTFTFTGTGGDGMAGVMYRIDGHDATTPITASATANFGGTYASPTFATSITPIADNILIQGVIAFNAGAGYSSPTVSGYAIATDNPTWTESIDTSKDGGGYAYGFATATAPRTQSSATGTQSLSIAGGAGTDTQVKGFMIAVQPYTVSGPANVKTFQGVAKASVKTLQGVAIASVKSSQGVV